MPFIGSNCTFITLANTEFSYSEYLALGMIIVILTVRLIEKH